jgi:hypothetical protein
MCSPTFPYSLELLVVALYITGVYKSSHVPYGSRAQRTAVLVTCRKLNQSKPIAPTRWRASELPAEERRKRHLLRKVKE